jgi:tetratricopeptide (TPR) repeat protein
MRITEMLTTKHLPLSFLLGVTFLLGCPKQSEPGQGENLDPKIEFQNGVKTLQKTDKKTGEIDYETALAYFRSAVNIDPNFAHAAYNAGWTAEQMSKKSDAIDFYRKAYEAKPSNEFLFALADSLTENSQGEEAVALYRSYLENNPTDHTVRYSLIKALTAAGDIDGALIEASEILTYNDEDITVYRLLSRSFYQAGRYDMSILCANKANEKLTDKAINEKCGERPGGSDDTSAYDTCSKEHPPVVDAGILNNMGVTYLTMEDEPSAISTFQEALTVEPNHLEANLNLGFIALNSGNYPYALERFDTALISNANNLNAKLGKAIALRGVQDFDAASKLYKQILASDSTSKEIYFNVAILQAKYLQNYKEAEKLLQTYQSNNPNDTEVQGRIDNIKTLQQEEADKRAAQAAKEKEEAERAKRQAEQMGELKTKVATLQADAATLSSCPEAVESGAVEMAMMVIEQGQMVVDAEEIEMAADVMPFVDDSQSALNSLKDICSGGGSAPEEAPSEEVETPPETE